MPTKDAAAGRDESVGLGLRQAIEAVRDDLLAARASGDDADIRLPVERVVVQLQVVAAREAGGRAGLRVPFVNLELGGSGSVSSGLTSTVTVEFGVPVDRQGVAVKVSQTSDTRNR